MVYTGQSKGGEMRRSMAVFVAMLLCVAGMLAGTGSASAAAKRVAPHYYVMRHPKAKCAAHYVKRTLRLHEHGKMVRVVGCVFVRPVVHKKAVKPITVGTTGTKTLVPPTVTADPPTGVTITSNDNPAVVGASVTYTVTVASTAIPQTTGQLEVFDNGVALAGCDPIAVPTYPGNGTFVGTCSTIYSAATVDVISAVFTGDSVFAQSEGSMTETVFATAPATTSTTTVTSSGGGGGTITTTTSSPPAVATTKLIVGLASPAFTQAAGNGLDVTYAADASATSTLSGVTTAIALPAATLTFYAGARPVCTVAVSATTPSGTCQIDYNGYGPETVTVGITDGTDSPDTTGAVTEDIGPLPVADTSYWGSSVTNTVPAAAINVSSGQATVTITDANFEGAASLTATAYDATGAVVGTCTATVGTSTALCAATNTMAVSGTPASLKLSYPGGATTVTAASGAPNWTPQITTTWPAETSAATISGARLSVSVYGATVVWVSAVVTAVFDWTAGSAVNGATVPPSPLAVTTSQTLRVQQEASGNVPGDAVPLGTIDLVVTGGTGWTGVNDEAGSTDCSAMTSGVGTAYGYCALTFSTPGTYVLTPKYVSADANYGGIVGPSVTVDVTQ